MSQEQSTFISLCVLMIDVCILGHHPNRCRSHDEGNYKLKVDPFQKKREGICRLISGNLYAERNRFRKEAVYSKFLAENPMASKHHMTTHPPSVTEQVQKIKRGGGAYTDSKWMGDSNIAGLLNCSFFITETGTQRV